MSASRAASALRQAGFAGELRADAPLAPLTTWRIGGPAELLAVPAEPQDVARAVRWARQAGMPWRVLGNGSNLLVQDQGVPGLVIRICKALDRMTVEGDEILAGAGASFPALANRAADAGLAGLSRAPGGHVVHTVMVSGVRSTPVQ